MIHKRYHPGLLGKVFAPWRYIIDWYFLWLGTGAEKLTGYGVKRENKGN